MSGKPKIVGTWDAMAEAVDILNNGGLAFVLTVGMDGSRLARSRTNAASVEAFDWLERKHREYSPGLREQF